MSIVQSAVVTPVLNRMGGGALLHVAHRPQGLGQELLWTVLFVAVWDLWQYWVHRLQHGSAVLWKTHMLHHSDRAVNSSTAQRHALTHYVLHSVLWTPMLLIFAGLPMNLAVAFVMFHFWGFVNHADLRWHFGRMTMVFSGPYWHRIHHSRLPEHRDKNFAAFFPVIDRLFGTYYRPALDE